jgi:hypothetical protein
MEDMVLGRLMQALANPDVRSLTLAPGREAALVHIRPDDDQGWVFTLRCRPVLAGLLRASVARGGGHASTVAATGPFDGRPMAGPSRDGSRTDGSPMHGPPQVQLELAVPQPQLAGRLLGVLLRDHTRTRPDERLSAFVLEEGEPVARLLELYRPAPHPSRSQSTLVVLPAAVVSGS